jgi:hypothetical protein
VRVDLAGISALVRFSNAQDEQYQMSLLTEIRNCKKNYKYFLEYLLLASIF